MFKGGRNNAYIKNTRAYSVRADVNRHVPHRECIAGGFPSRKSGQERDIEDKSNNIMHNNRAVYNSNGCIQIKE